MSDPAIVLIGFMGAGKSTAIQALNESGVASARDLDAEIEAREGRPVLDLFHEDEERFRALEREIALEMLAEAGGDVVAFGGGTAMQPDVQAVLTDHKVVMMDVKAETAWNRVSRSDRPLVQRGKEQFEQLFAERRPTYEKLAQVVLPEARPDAIVDALPWIRDFDRLPIGTRMIWASSESGGYPIFVGADLLGCGWWPLPGERCCVADGTVGPLYADRLAPLAGMVEIPPGESAKTMAEAERVLREMARLGVTREDHVVALGGGVAGDLAGFCAHLYQRGVPVVQVPTTLVAQVDSAYGGKTGVDLPEGKNYAGAYHLPAAVIADTSTLASLPREELAAGFVEVLKTGLLAGGALWERVRAIEDIDPDDLADVVFACARYKCEIVAADERDAGLRQVLNLGHTVGHAIEAASGYRRYRHGEAIGLGLLAALRLSDAPGLRAEVEALLRRHDLPVELDSQIGVDAVLDALQRDKKRTAAGVGFVLLSEPGVPRVGRVLDDAGVRAAVLELQP